MNGRVLIIDDDALIAEIIAAILVAECDGVRHTRIVGTMLRALEMLSAEQWDIVILDLQLPDSDPTHTLSRVPEIKAHGVDVVLAVTGYEITNRLREFGLSNGADDVVSKDVFHFKDELCAAVNKTLLATHRRCLRKD